MRQTGRWFTLGITISLALLGVVSVLASAPVGVSQANLLSQTAATCAIRSITVTSPSSGLDVLDTMPYAGVSRTVFFTPPPPPPAGTSILPEGIKLTVLLDVPADGTCYLYGGAAFSNTEISMFQLNSNSPFTNIVYAVSPWHGPQSVQIDVASSPSGTLVMPHPQAMLTFDPRSSIAALRPCR